MPVCEEVHNVIDLRARVVRQVRRLAVGLNMAPQHRQAAFTIGRVAGLHHHIKHQSTAPGAQVDLVSVVRLAPALADDVGMRLEQTHHLLAGRHRFAVEHAALGLLHHPLEQVPAGAHLGTPTLGPRLSYATHFSQCRRRVGDRVRHQAQQPLVGGRPPLLAARRADLLLAPLGSTAVVAKRHRLKPLARLPQQPRQHPHAVVQQAAVRRLQDIRLGHRAVDTHLRTRFDPPLLGVLQQHAVDRLPRVGVDRADGALQRRLLRHTERIDPREALHAGGIEQRELQPPIAVAHQMHEHRTAQNGLAGQPRATPGGAARHAGADHVEQFGVLIEPCRSAFQFAGDRMDNFWR